MEEGMMLRVGRGKEARWPWWAWRAHCSSWHYSGDHFPSAQTRTGLTSQRRVGFALTQGAHLRSRWSLAEGKAERGAGEGTTKIRVRPEFCH